MTTPRTRLMPSEAPAVPVRIRPDRTLRVKILDACGLACTFCHNEGTPVLADNRTRPGGFAPAGPSGRVSIYVPGNGVTFVATTIRPDDAFSGALARLADAFGFEEVHFTGGEPTLHPRLADLVAIASCRGLRVAMTSNGENGAAVIADAAKAGLDRVNFSVFGTTPAELASVQGARFADEARAQRKLDALDASIAACAEHGVRASANLVIPDRTHLSRVHRLLERYGNRVQVRLLNSLDDGQASLDAIAEVLAELRAEPIERHIAAGASGAKTVYRIEGGGIIAVKELRRVRLPATCAGCRFNNDTDCTEGYYGLRLYRDQAGRFQVGVCLQRMDLCEELDGFLTSARASEVRRFRENEYDQLTRHYAPGGN
jgi:molybdenum cofactor biosynthesis enzyme MoaA